MAPWVEGKRKGSWASNGNIAVYIFAALFVVWLGFQIWARLPGGPLPPTGLEPMVMAALGVAITTKSVERRQVEDDRQTYKDDRQKENDDLTEQVKKLKKRLETKDSGESA